MLNKLGMYYRTIKYLKPIQIRYRLWYLIRNKFRKLVGHSYASSITKNGHLLNLQDSTIKPGSLEGQTFNFLNQSHIFKQGIDWNFDKFGKLWVYNLNYFDYLNQHDLSKEVGLALIRDFLSQEDENEQGLEPYPISLRGINWIKFLTRHQISDPEIDAGLYAQYQILLDNLEFHLMGNHLMENACSLLYGGYYFQDQKLLDRANKILLEQLDEQILSDGGHFERSTMYHCIILERLLDCYNLLSNNEDIDELIQLKQLMQGKIKQMLGWAKTIFPNDEVLPLLNDAAPGVASGLNELINYAKRLGLSLQNAKLSESGYRAFTFDDNHLVFDVGEIRPDYQPGHAHAGVFSFILYKNGKPLIIDPGISTYEDNEVRHRERSTSFHNTVVVAGKNQSEVWSAFRVGRRVSVEIPEEQSSPEFEKVEATHDGYRYSNIGHRRKWYIDKKKNIVHMVDHLEGVTNKYQARAFIHFSEHLSESISVEGNTIKASGISIGFENCQNIKLESYCCPNGYNSYVKAKRAVIDFENDLETIIKL